MNVKSFLFPQGRQHSLRTIAAPAASLLLLALLSTSAAWGQQESNRNVPVPSDLALQNMRRVAASAPELKAILLKESGLMVELKRWVAKDSTDHGQIVGDAELNDYAIFDRLETDIEFRSVATALVQRYGYLLPKVNPESDLAKEQDLLRLERTKWVAQAEEEERAQSRQKATEEMKKAAACQAQHTSACDESQPGASPQRVSTPASPNDVLPSLNGPFDQTIPNNPNATGVPLQRAQLMQTGGYSSGGFSQGSQFSLSNTSAGRRLRGRGKWGLGSGLKRVRIRDRIGLQQFRTYRCDVQRTEWRSRRLAKWNVFRNESRNGNGRRFLSWIGYGLGNGRPAYEWRAGQQFVVRGWPIPARSNAAESPVSARPGFPAIRNGSPRKSI